MHRQGDFMARLMNILDSRAISQTLPNNDGTYKAICFTTPNLNTLMADRRGGNRSSGRCPRTSIQNALRWLEGCHPTRIPAWKGRARDTAVTQTAGSPSVIQTSSHLFLSPALKEFNAMKKSWAPNLHYLHLSEHLSICNQPSGQNALALHSSLEVSPSYEPASTVTATHQEEAGSTSHISMEFTCSVKLQDIPEPTTRNLSTVHPGCLHLPSSTLPTIPK